MRVTRSRSNDNECDDDTRDKHSKGDKQNDDSSDIGDSCNTDNACHHEGNGTSASG